MNIYYNKFDTTAFAAEVRKRRTDRRLTLQQVDTKTGANYHSLSQMEQGTIKNPTIDTVLRLAIFFGIDIMDYIRPVEKPVSLHKSTLSGSRVAGTLK